MEDELTALHGTVNGIAHTLLHLIDALEREEVIDGPRLCAALREWSGRARESEPFQWQCCRVVDELADRLDDQRRRRSGRGRTESRES